MKKLSQPFELDGDTIVYGTIYEVSPCVGVVILSHDVHEHRFQYLPLIEAFNERGLSVITYDLRGHHQSVQDGIPGHFDKDNLKQDLLKVFNISHQYFPGTNITLMGGKITSWLIYHVLEDIEIASVIMVAPYKRSRSDSIKQLMLKLLPSRSKFLMNHLWSGEESTSSDDPFAGRPLTHKATHDALELTKPKTHTIVYPLRILLMGQQEDEQLLENMRQHLHNANLYDIHLLTNDSTSIDNVVQFILN